MVDIDKYLETATFHYPEKSSNRRKRMKRSLRIMIIVALSILVIFMITGCVPDANPMVGICNANGQMAGFLSGLLHGMISPVTFIFSLFSDKINFYEVHNNGAWYNLGFVLGAGILFGGGGKAS